MRTTQAKTKTQSRGHWIFTLAAVCLVLGALLAIQVRSRTTGENLRTYRIGGDNALSELGRLLASTQEKVDEQAEEIVALRQKLNAYEEAAAKETGMGKPMVEQLKEFRFAMGLTEASGPGIVLEIDDSPMTLGDKKFDELQSMFIIHDFDLLQITNELWSAGAEAIAINGQRIVAGTAIRCTGSTTDINKTAVTAPYEFIALGDSETLANALNMPNGVLDRLRPLKFRIRLQQEEELSVPPVTTTIKFRFSQPVEDSTAPKTTGSK